MRKHAVRSPLGYYTIGVAALFLAGFFLMVVLGAQTYRRTVEVQTGNNQDRALLGYFATCISSNDSRGAVTVEESAYGPVLVVPDGATGYGLRIYCYEGSLLEDYGRLTAELNPDEETAIARTEVFDAQFVKDGLLQVTTDAGSIRIRVRSEGGAQS